MKVHDLALRADYEIASKEQEYFFELDVSNTHTHTHHNLKLKAAVVDVAVKVASTQHSQFLDAFPKQQIMLKAKLSYSDCKLCGSRVFVKKIDTFD